MNAETPAGAEDAAFLALCEHREAMVLAWLNAGRSLDRLRFKTLRQRRPRMPPPTTCPVHDEPATRSRYGKARYACGCRWKHAHLCEATVIRAMMDVEAKAEKPLVTLL